jgi:hypothetical protein
MTQRDSNRITQRDKTCPVAVASGRDKPFKGYPSRSDRMPISLMEKSHRDTLDLGSHKS